MFPDGICRVTDSYYTKTVQFQDINYQLNQNEDKTAIFDGWCDFLNYFDSSVCFQLSFVNMSANKDNYARYITISPQGDDFDSIRLEYTQMLQNQLARGNNGLIKTKYLTFGVEADGLKAAKPRLERIETDILNNFKRLGVAAALCVQNGLCVLVSGPAVILHQPIVPADGGQALVGVVLPQGQPVFAAAGHHAVRVHDALGHKVIHQRTEVARMTRQNELFFAPCIAGGVQAGQQPLRSRFLVAGGAIELTRTVQTANVLALQRCFQTGRVHTVVFDGVGRTHDLDVLKPLDAPVEGVLHIFRQASGSTL